MIRHLLVTNDFPPKVGGIQSYLWELWRRLPPGDVTVLTSPYRGAADFDRAQPFRVERTPEPVLLPGPLMARRIRRLAAEVGAEAVVLDPAVPLGLVGPALGIPYAAVLHGAEVTVPGRLPVTRGLLARVLRNASLLISAGGYPEAEARRAESRLPPVVQIPPGVDTARFVPLPAGERSGVRCRLRLPADGPLVVSVSRLVPRKGMDVLIEAAARLRERGRDDVTVAIAGTGRDRARLERLVAHRHAPVRLIGRVGDADLPALYASADVFALCCRSRWAGLEQEGFGIVFLEAAAAGVPSVAGASGGAAEAVVDGVTGTVVARPADPDAVADALSDLLDDPAGRCRQGRAARERAVEEFSYDVLAARLETALDGLAARHPAQRGAMAGTRPAWRTTLLAGNASPRRFPDVEEQVTERMIIRGTPDDCYGVLIDFERYPEWAADIKAVQVDERDGEGRARVVTFRAAAFGRSTSYTLRYDYSRAPEELSWVQTAGDITRRLDGAYHLAPSGNSDTEIEYRLVVDLKVPLPGFVKRRAEGRIMGTALRELKAVVEGSDLSGGSQDPAIPSGA